MSLRTRLIFLAILTILCVIIAVPSTWKDSWNLPNGLGWLTEPHVNKGLDLAGGVGLDFKIDMTKVPEDRRQQVITGIRQVLNSRVNTLGVSEPEIVNFQVGNEEHIRVTLAGVSKIEDAVAIIGKTIQLEFKVKPDAAQVKEQGTKMRTLAEKFLKDWSAKPEAKKELFDAAKAGQSSGDVVEGTKTLTESAANPDLKTVLDGLKEGEFAKTVVETSFTQEQGDAFVTVQGMAAVRLVKKGKELVSTPMNGVAMEEMRKQFGDNKTLSLGMVRSTSDLGKKSWMTEKLSTLQERQVSDVIETPEGFMVLKAVRKFTEDQEVMKASHILFTTEKDGTSPETASKNEVAKKTAEDTVARLQKDPTQFDALAKELTQEPGGKERAGALGDYFIKGQNNYVKEFTDAAFALEEGKISGAVKTEFGYHIIKATEKKKKGETWAQMEQILVCYKGATDPSCANATRTKEEAKARAENAMKQLREEDFYTFEYAIFNSVPQWVPAIVDGKELTGQYFQRADAVFQEGSSLPIVRIEFNAEGATLFEKLTEKFTGQQMAIFVGGQEISAPVINGKIPGGVATIQGSFTVPDAVKLARNLNTGAIPAPVTLSGQEIVGPELGQGAFEKSLIAGLVGIIVLSLYLIAYYRLSGVLAVLSLFLYTIMYITVIKLVPGFNLTLASVAALILSVGMAVDGNVLIFERFKEEMGKSGNVQANIKKAFERAWSAIRDSQVSSLITALILFWLGTEAVKGFAVYLIFGIILSLFTSITVTRTLMQGCASLGLYKNKK